MKFCKHLHVLTALLLIVGAAASCTNEDDCSEETSSFSLVEISEVTSSSFNVNGVVTPPPCERLNVGFSTGVVLSTNPDPSFENGIDYGSSSLTFDLDIGGLSPETTYYLKPYLIISLRRFELGSQYEITTLP
jgi:hypothetical protein